MRLPTIWEEFLSPHLNFDAFYKSLDTHLAGQTTGIPYNELIFNVFNYVQPLQVNCILYGEDPYPRLSSANGVAFWDAEVKSWEDITSGNALKNILKALLVARGLADYNTPISQCRQIAGANRFPAPAQLFESWLARGILLINTALTFSGPADKTKHFAFWRPFHQALIFALNKRQNSPFYVLWGRKAWRWQEEINQSIDDFAKIIKQNHPTFIHQFLKPQQPHWSPFTEIEALSGLKWLL